MDIELVETIRLIIERYENRTSGSVFIKMEDFPWYNERNGQLTNLCEEGLITKPQFYDDGAYITLTQKGWHFFDKRDSCVSLTKEKIYEILSLLSKEMKVPEGNFGYEPRLCRGAIKQLQEQGFLSGIGFATGGRDPNPQIMWIEQGFITVKGLQFIEDYEKNEVDITQEFISACAKIADNPVSYAGFDEDGLNREIRNYLDSAISRFGYSIADQTQQGMGKSEKKPNELDIRINKNGIPVAIYEGLIHNSEQYLYNHIDKAIQKYNLSGCNAVYVVEFSKNKGFGGFWDNACDSIEKYDRVNVKEVNTELLGVRLLNGTFEWEGKQGSFNYIGVNCYSK